MARNEDYYKGTKSKEKADSILCVFTENSLHLAKLQPSIIIHRIMENHFAELFDRDLIKLRDEIKSFKDENNLWRKLGGISNTAGTLALHLLGNLNYTIGAVIGNTGYVREREKEFNTLDVPQLQLVASIENLIEIVKSSLTDISVQKLAEQYPLEIFGQKSTAWYLTHFYGHLNYHLGQINYLRRILEG